MILRFLPLLSMISCASGDFGSSLALFLEDASSQSIESWKQIAMFVMIYLIVTLILFVNTFCICRINRQPKQAKVEPVLKTVVINVHHDKEPRVVNLSLRQTLPSERRSSRVESSDAATLERIISTKTARLKDSLRRDAKTARDGLSHREKAMVREIASATARSIRELSKKSKSSSNSKSSSSSSSSSSSTPSDRSSRSRRSSSSSRYSSDRSSHSGSRSSRSDNSHRLSSSRSSSNRSSRSRK
jgi:hypothetical protein